VKTLLVAGTGLIGGSFALAARKAHLFDRVLGVDRADVLAHAQRLGIIDAGADDLASGVAQADVVFVAVPPGVTAAVLADVFHHAPAHPQVVFDGASVKRAVIDELHARVGALPSSFVPAHPMAGSERHGPAAASADLYAGCHVFLTPERETGADALQCVRDLWEGLGAHVHETGADRHDEMVAITSHLPHLVAYAYMALVADRSLAAGSEGGTPPLAQYAGSGFRDFTRIAASDPALWRQILEANRDQVAAQLDAISTRLAGLRGLLAAGRFDDLQAELERARDAHAGVVHGSFARGRFARGRRRRSRGSGKGARQ
jgi:prephenate dehydrogenase